MRPTTRLLLILCFTLQPATGLSAPGSQALPEVEFDQAVHFNSSHGDDILVTPGTYQVAATKDALRLMPQSAAKDHTDPWFVQAGTSVHDLKLETLDLLSIVGEDGNAHHLVYLMPGGQAFEAIGSYSAVRTRAATSLWSQKLLGRKCTVSTPASRLCKHAWDPRSEIWHNFLFKWPDCKPKCLRFKRPSLTRISMQQRPSTMRPPSNSR